MLGPRPKPPLVTFEITSAQSAGAFSGFPYKGRLLVRGEPFVEVGLPSSDHAESKERLVDFVASTAPKISVLVNAFRSALRWEFEASLALAIGYTSVLGIVPSHLLGWRFAGKKGRGRPKAADHVTHQVFQLVQGWWIVTGRKPSPFGETEFTRAMIAAAPILPILNRRGDVVSETTIHEFFRQELAKLSSSDFQLVPPSEIPGRINPTT